MASCWGITDGSDGMKAQIKALAQVLELDCEMKTIALKKHFSWQPNSIWAAGYKHLILSYALDKKKSSKFIKPWPDFVISCGRKAALISMGLSAANPPPSTKFINIQDPRTRSKHFDLIIAMEHDKITGENVIKTRFALHSITNESLARARTEFSERFASYPKPHIAVLLGGSTNKYKITPRAVKNIITTLEQYIKNSSASLLITPSRRTGTRNIKLITKYFQSDKQVYIYDGSKPNSYMGILALADAVIVTNDSVNMMSEAQATGKPLYILPLSGHKRTKPARFADKLIKDGIARRCTGKIEKWDYQKSDEMNKIREKIKQYLSNK